MFSQRLSCVRSHPDHAPLHIGARTVSISHAFHLPFHYIITCITAFWFFLKCNTIRIRSSKIVFIFFARKKEEKKPTPPGTRTLDPSIKSHSSNRRHRKTHFLPKNHGCSREKIQFTINQINNFISKRKYCTTDRSLSPYPSGCPVFVSLRVSGSTSIIQHFHIFGG